MRSIAISVWSLSVCLSVCPLAYFKSHTSKCHILCTCWANYLWLTWLGPSLTARRYVMYFRFYEWRHVSTWWTESAKIISYDAYISSSSPGDGAGGEVCRLWQHLVLSLILHVSDWHLISDIFVSLDINHSNVLPPVAISVAKKVYRLQNRTHLSSFYKLECR